MTIEVIGLAAGLLTTVSSLPQIYRILKTKSAQDISLYTYLMILPGVLLWLLYGVSADAIAVILWNTIAFVFNGTIFILKIADDYKALP